jgi:hypothetical protein
MAQPRVFLGRAGHHDRPNDGKSGRAFAAGMLGHDDRGTGGDR